MFSRLREFRRFTIPLILLLGLTGLLLLYQQPWNIITQTSSGLPGVTPVSGRYPDRVTVRFQTTNPRGQIVYTLDGSEPTAETGTLYTKPLILDEQGVTTVRAVEVTGGNVGPIRTTTYVIGIPGQLPVLSIALPPAALWDNDTGILANPTWRGAEWERAASIAYIMADGTVGFTAPAGIRVDREGTKPDLRLYFRSEYGVSRLSYPLFPGHQEQSVDTQRYNRLLLLGGHPGNAVLSNANGGLWRDRIASECASAVGLHTAQLRAVHLFINGESWGLYYLSERVDRFFLEDNYGYRQADAVREGKTVEGDDADWDALVDWVSTHDLSMPDHYAYVLAQIDSHQLIDTIILSYYLDLPPDAFIAVRPQMGRWEWIFAGGGEIPISKAYAGDKSDLEILYTKLLANEQFRHAYAVRTVDLLNTVLSPMQMEARIAALMSDLGEDYHYERGRWFYGEAWDNEMLLYRQWMAQRADVLYDLAQEYTGLGDAVQVELAVAPPEAGVLYVNNIPLDFISETAIRFFAGTAVTLTAQPDRWPLPGYRFTGWESCEEQHCQPIGSSPELVVTDESLQRVTAQFTLCVPGECDVAANTVVISEYWINDNGTRYGSLNNRGIVGDWVELRVLRDGADLRGWRLTDNDTLAGTTEGSIILPDDPGLAALRKNTVILLITTQNKENTAVFPEDDMDSSDRRLLFYVGNDNLDVTTDPGFGIGQRDDNLVLLAPGPTVAFDDDIGIDFVAEGSRVTPFSFGILGDGVSFTTPFRFLGRDDGAIWPKTGNPDQGALWRVDPPACQSGDAICWGERNQVTPGR